VARNEEDRVADVNVNARNVPCPVPILRVSRAMRDLETGQTVELVTTDEGAHVDIPAWASDMGHSITEIFERDGELHFVIVKA
jgi:TusA-related sulfurtransferase